MAGYYYSANFPDPRGTMETLGIQGEARRDLPTSSGLPVPNEITMEILENLVPAHNLFNPVYVGSMSLTSAIEMRTTLHGLCRVCRGMNQIAFPYLYRVIVIRDSNELRRLHETLMKGKPAQGRAGLGGYIKSLAVHQNIVLPPPGQGRYMSPGDFSNTIVSILRRAPCLTKFSLVPIRTEAQENSHDFFLPRVETLGVLISNTPRLALDQPPEDKFFTDLLNLASRGHGADQGGQGTLPLGKAITSLDMRGSWPPDWKNVGAIGLAFTDLSSLSTWYAVQHWTRANLLAWWELRKMRSLRHLRIDVQAGNSWGDRFRQYRELWGRPDEPFDLCELPNLQTLRVPLRLFVESDEDSMHSSIDVLPDTLDTLVLFVDLQLHLAEPLANEESEWRGHQVDGYFISDPRSCAQTIWLVVEFLQDIIYRLAESDFSNLETLVLEYKIDHDFGGRDWSFRNEAMGEFMGTLEHLRESFGMQGVNLSWVEL